MSAQITAAELRKLADEAYNDAWWDLEKALRSAADQLEARSAATGRLVAAARAVHDEHWTEHKGGYGEWSGLQMSRRSVVDPKYIEFHDALAALDAEGKS